MEHIEWSVKICGTATVRDGKKAHTVYILEVKKGPEPSWRLYKRYSQFDEFNDQLKERFPRIPKFPGKRFFGDSMEPSFVQKRRGELDAYIQGLLLHPAIASSVVVRAFLESDKDVQPLNMTEISMVESGRPGPSGAASGSRSATGGKADAQQTGAKQKTRDDLLKEIFDRTVASMVDITQAPEAKEAGDREKMLSQRAAQVKGELSVGTFALPRPSASNTAAAVPEILASTALTPEHAKALEDALETVGKTMSSIARQAGP